jgi:HD-GYP domain-containing protein (c-di-GMP phosphodiesterase class II)
MKNTKIINTYNALTSNRPYRAAKDSNFALDILRLGSGIEFDQEIVEVLNKLVKTSIIV